MANLATLVVQAQDTAGRTAVATFFIPIAQTLLPTWPDPLPNGQVGVPYSFTLTAIGGVLPYTFSVTSGVLPAGITLNAATGILSGTPSSAVSFAAVTFGVSDSGP